MRTPRALRLAAGLALALARGYTAMADQLRAAGAP